MGCSNGITKQQQEDPILMNGSKGENLHNKKSNKQESTENQNFQVSTADFVAQKTGKIYKDYTILNPALGKGAFGEVRKAIQKVSKLIRAIKIIQKKHATKDEIQNLITEVEVLKTLVNNYYSENLQDHPNILKVFEYYQDEHSIYIVTELCQGGELFDRIIDAKFFSEQKAARILKQLMSAVFYCHQHNIVHRDLKPENLLLETNDENSNIKVIDFGTSMVFDPLKKMNQKFGTPYYIAPEVLKKKYDYKCDIWSSGVILYILLSGLPPFNGANDKIIMDKVKAGHYTLNIPEFDSVSHEARDLIKKMLEYDPVKRISAGEVLQHPWIKRFGNEQIAEENVILKTLDSLRSFRAGYKLQEATWMFLVNILATKQEKDELLKSFKALDSNGDGQLSKQELIDGYKKIMGANEAEEEVEKIMQTVDKNNSGEIDFTEFVMATINREKMLSKNRLLTIFKIFDKDGSGTISVQELKENFGSKITDEAWKEMIAEVNKNGEEEISYKEFSEMMIKLL